MQISSSINWHQTLLIAILLLATISDFSFAMGERPAQPDKQQQEAIAKFLENEKYQKQPICNEPLIVTIANTKLSLPRGIFVTFTTSDQKTYEHMERRCEIKQLNNLASVSWPNMALYDASNIIETDFHKYVTTKIEASKKIEIPTLLENGIEQMRIPGSIIFAVPVNLIPTHDKNKVLFNCSVGEHSEFFGPANCTTSYLFKNNLGLSYRYFGLKNKLHDMLLVDKHMRETIEKYIIVE